MTAKLNRIFIIIAILFAASCGREKLPGGEESENILSVDETEFATNSNECILTTNLRSSGVVVINASSNVDWVEASIEDYPEDVAKSVESGKNRLLKFVVKQNKAREERTAEFMLSSPYCTDVIVTITQEAYVYRDPTRELLSFSIKKQNGIASDISFTLNKTDKTLTAKYLKWIEKENPEMLVPTFTFKGEKVMVGETELVSGKTEINFADDFDLEVFAENGERDTYRVSINCPQINRELPVLHIRPDSRITSDKVNYTDTYIELYDKTPTSTGTGWWDSKTQGKIQMRRRGNSTWELPKKPFRMKFPEKISPIGFDHCCEKSWVLVANDMDKSLLRNYIAFEYSRILFVKHQGYHDSKALKFTSIAQPINVYFTGDYKYSDTGVTRHLDGEYFGVYQFSDQMNKCDGRIDVDKLTAADTDPAMITGGYIVEFDLHEGNHYSSRGVKMTYKYPDEDDYHWSQYEYITDFINKAESALYSSNYKDPNNGWRKYFDERTLADYIIIKELVGDMDGYTSTYLYKRRGVDKLFFGPIWDCDKGWDNDRRVPHYQYQPLTSLMIYAGFWINSGMSYDWYQRFWDDETFRAFVNNRWKEKKEELLAKTWEVLDEMPKKMAKAIDANFSVWQFYYQYSSEAKMPAATYEKEIERIRELTKKRAELLDKEFAK